ncbi:MAG: tetratricopeptide repeat protein [Desulfobacterales bacterium]|uniref:Tetratricopeptide repeat protein n=1 Tax=Candidatus Desulfaltia bathyphila TaxID=2841697 RepID=A0A8J6N3P9_9BACT|nr:tetratricopeptide repeat protein [Candidatus Desulfaltia bathyphila]MBL7194740.1 tetratricopeptide repeat protein [Desulfobacterales bacterium]MBL7206956.1 tetratricopeptide repeat protein [Desulfobacterales bacterium]
MRQFIDIKRHHKILTIYLLLILIILVAYWQVKNFDFVNFDDSVYVTANPKVQSGLTIDGITWAFTTFRAGNWHPLTWLSHMLDCQFYGLNPMGHHWTSLQIHIANTLLLFFILQYMTGALWRSAFVAALFALHPLHVESVAWVSERKDVLSAFFGMLTILAYIRYVKKRNFFRYFLVFILLSLGLMAKPMLVTLPFVLLLLDFWPLERLKYSSYHQSSGFQSLNLPRLIWEKAPLFIPVAISSVLTILAQKEVGALYTFEALPVKVRIANAFVSYANYIIKTIWPQNLAVFYPHPLGISSLWYVFLAAFAIAGISFFSIRSFKQHPYVAIGWFWYLGTLVPVIGLIQVGAQSMADRYTYIPLTGLFIIIAWGIPDILKKWHFNKIIIAVFAIILIFAFSTRSYFQIRHWENSAAVFENAIKITNYNWLACNNLGLALMCNGKAEEAVFYFKKALRIRPNYLKLYDNLGVALFQLGKLEEALSYYSKALEIDPKHAGIHKHTAMILATQGKLEKALQHYTKALLIDPELADAHYELANVLVNQEKLEKAKFQYKEAIKKDPKHSNAHYNLGCILLKQKEYKEALANFAQVIKINPDYKQAYNYIGIILVQKGKFKKAKKFFSKALQIDPDYSEALKNLKILNQMKE